MTIIHSTAVAVRNFATVVQQWAAKTANKAYENALDAIVWAHHEEMAALDWAARELDAKRSALRDEVAAELERIAKLQLGTTQAATQPAADAPVINPPATPIVANPIPPAEAQPATDLPPPTAPTGYIGQTTPVVDTATTSASA